MIELNLLPPKVRDAQALRRIVILAVLAYALAGGWLAWQWTLNHVRVVAARHDVERVQAQLNSPQLQVAVQAVKKFSDDMAAVKAQASVVDSLRTQQTPLLRAMDEVPDWGLAGQVWLSTLTLDAGDKGGASVSLEGQAATRADFAGYYEGLQARSDVQGLALDRAPQENEEAGLKAYRFSLKLSLAGQP